MMAYPTPPVSVGRRLAAMLLDHVLMCFVAMLFFLPALIGSIASAFEVSHQHTDLSFMEGPAKYIGLFGFSLYFCKDIFNGRSMAKRILGLQVVDAKTGQVASPLQCFVRDVFCVFWIVEVVVAMINTGRRIGDRVAGTRLERYDPVTGRARPGIAQLALPVALSFGLLVLLVQLLPLPGRAGAAYSKTSYNPVESRQLEERMTDRLGQYLTPDISIYDTVENKKYKYVSIILRLKENYLADEASYNRLHDTTTGLIYAWLPKDLLTGVIRYVYRGSRQFQQTTATIGTFQGQRRKE